MTEPEKMREASEWWLKLQEDSALEQGGEWLGWSQGDKANLDAFDRVDSLASGLRNISGRERREMLREFGGRRNPMSWALAAGVALLAVGGLIYLYLRQSVTTYATERAMHQEVTLADGSLLTVGGDSVVSVRMRADERHIQLRSGEAYFRVRQDSVRPFVVEAGDVSVTALGTAFDVRRTGADVAVSVTDGKVRVARRGGSAASVDLSAGQRMSYAPTERQFKLSAVTAERATAWRERRLEFVNEPLSVVIANVNRYSSAPVEIRDATAGKLTFTGTVLPENLSSWLNALPNVLPVRVERDGNGVRVESASER